MVSNTNAATYKESSITAGSANTNKVVIMAGLALFAMFFGAGNLVFPLFLGANSSEFFITNALGFLLAGVGVPILGLLATSLYRGNYWDFFSSLGKVPAFAIVTFLMIIIGPLGAMPRIETLVFSTLEPFMPSFIPNSLFSIFFCGVILGLAIKGNKVVSILGSVLSPIKLVAFSILIFVGLWFAEPCTFSSGYTASALKTSLSQGYSTMDLLATFFFCTVVFNSIESTMQESKFGARLQKDSLTKMIIKASIIGGALISVVYIGFMIVAYYYAGDLQGVPQEKMVQAISDVVLGRAGSVFVSLTVSFACLATGLSLAESCSMFLKNEVFKNKFSRLTCLIIVMFVTYIVSNLSFGVIMKYMLPVLEVVYPALITLCVMNIIYKLTGFKFVKIPVYLTALIFLFI